MISRSLATTALPSNRFQGDVGPSTVIQERSFFEAPSPPPGSEISKIEEVATFTPKNTAMKHLVENVDVLIKKYTSRSPSATAVGYRGMLDNTVALSLQATAAKASISLVPSAAHVRAMRKGLINDHIALFTHVIYTSNRAILNVKYSFGLCKLML